MCGRFAMASPVGVVTGAGVGLGAQGQRLTRELVLICGTTVVWFNRVVIL